MRVSDADRDRLIVALREHLLAGRLTLEEFTERVEGALKSRVGADLARVRADLPEVASDRTGPRLRPTRLAAALLGHVTRRGRVRLRRWAFAASAFGDLDFDLRDAIIERPRTTVTVLAALGNVDIYVPEGVNADVTGMSIFGHRRDWGRDADRASAPEVRVRVIGVGGTIDVWRVPHDLRGSSYSEIFHRLEDRQRQLPA